MIPEMAFDEDAKHEGIRGRVCVKNES